MTKKDYEIIADALRYAKMKVATANYLMQNSEVANLFIETIANELKSDNDRFNEDKFYKACGY